MTDRSDGPAAYSDVESTMRPPLVTGLELGRLVVEPFLLPRADGGHPVRVVRVFLHTEGLARFCTEDYEAPSEANLGRSYAHVMGPGQNRRPRAAGHGPCLACR